MNGLPYLPFWGLTLLVIPWILKADRKLLSKQQFFDEVLTSPSYGSALSGNKANRFTVNFWRPNLPKLGRLFLRYGLVIMPPQHRG